MPKESPLEKDGEGRFKRTIESNGDLSIKIIPVSMVGFPDRIILLQGGVVFFIEFKRWKKKPTPIQLYVHKLLRKMGFHVYVCDSYQGALDVYWKEKEIHST